MSLETAVLYEPSLLWPSSPVYSQSTSVGTADVKAASDAPPLPYSGSRHILIQEPSATQEPDRTDRVPRIVSTLVIAPLLATRYPLLRASDRCLSFRTHRFCSSVAMQKPAHHRDEQLNLMMSHVLNSTTSRS